jgi:DNA-nicking Smr family endonuclease
MDTDDKEKSDARLFREAMADVKPLRRPDRIEPTAPRPAAVARQQEEDDREVLRQLATAGHPEDHETGDELLYLRPGYQARLLRRLRRGHYSIADSIDLHHMDVATARQVLADFIESALTQQRACVRIVHGKGLRSRDLPRLKLMTGRVLRRHPRVIAFAPCRPADGGTGATIVLLSARPARPA